MNQKLKVSNLKSQSIIGINIAHLNIEMGRLMLNNLFMETSHRKSLDQSPSKQNSPYKTKTAQYFL